MIHFGGPDIMIHGVMDTDTDLRITTIPGMVTGDIQAIITVIITMVAGPMHRGVGDIQRLVPIRKGIGIDAEVNWFTGQVHEEIAGITGGQILMMMGISAPRMTIAKIVA
jgi:hypothetical protein